MSNPMPDRITSADFQPEARVIQGDALAVLRTLEAESVHCVVTSPPYWSLRDYGVPGQLGLESTVQEYVANIVEVFREVRRVLRPDGTLWLNIGDSYVAGPTGHQDISKANGKAADMFAKGGRYRVDNLRKDAAKAREWGGLTPKNKCMIPARVAIALQEDGWVLRQEICWCKKSPMPESTRDRPTTAHEMVYLFAKSGDTTYYTHPHKPGVRGEVPPPDYRWHDNVTGERTAIEPEGWRTELMEDGKTKRWRRINLWEGHDYFYDQEAERVPAGQWGERTPKESRDPTGMDAGQNWNSFRTYSGSNPAGRNLWSYWLLSPDPYSEAHFATFPRELARRCISLGTSAYGCCAECGAPWARDKQREMSYNTAYGHAQMQQMPGAEATGGVRQRPAEEGWEAAGVSQLRFTGTESLQEGEPSEGETAAEGLSGGPQERGARTQEALHFNAQGEGTDAGRESAVSSNRTGEGKGTRTGPPICENPSRAVGWADTVQPQTGALEGCSGGIHETGLDQNPGNATEPLQVLPTPIHGETTPNDRPRNSSEQGRGAQPREHRGGVPSLQFSQVSENAIPDSGVGWAPTCIHSAPVQSCIVLDPFSGAGTTGVVAVGLGRRYLGIELSPAYVEMSERRIAQTQPALPGLAV